MPIRCSLGEETFSVVVFYRCFHWASCTVMETTSEITSQNQEGIQCNQGDSNSDGDDGGDDGGDNDGGKHSRRSCFAEVLSQASHYSK